MNDNKREQRNPENTIEFTGASAFVAEMVGGLAGGSVDELKKMSEASQSCVVQIREIGHRFLRVRQSHGLHEITISTANGTRLAPAFGGLALSQANN